MENRMNGKNSTRMETATRTTFYLLRFNIALQIAIAAIMVNVLLAVTTFIYGYNSLYCAFGTDSIIGVLTAIILVWRFASNKQESINLDLVDQPVDPETERNFMINIVVSKQTEPLIEKLDCKQSDDDNDDLHPFLRSMQSTIEATPEDNRRELWSTFWLGQIMIVSGFGVVIRSIIELLHHTIEQSHQHVTIDDDLSQSQILAQQMYPLYILASISLGLNLILMAFKLFVYYHLHSNSMLIEGVNSFISAVFASMTIVSIQFHDYFTYLDQIVSIIFGVFLISYGIFNVLHTLAYTIIDLIKEKRRRSSYIIIP